MTTFEETLDLIRRNNEGGDVTDAEVQQAIEENNSDAADLSNSAEQYSQVSGNQIARAISRSSVGSDAYASLRQSLDDGTADEYGISEETLGELRWNTSGAETMSELAEEIEVGRLSAADAVNLAVKATAESRQEIDAALGLAEAPDEPDYRQQRRDLREAAREQIRRDPSLDIDEWNVDARAGELGDGRKMIILQDPETNRTRTLDLEADPTSPEDAVGDIDDRADAINWDSGNPTAPTLDSGGLSNGWRLAAAVAIGAGVLYGVIQ